MSVAQTVKRYTPQEYYELERNAEYKSDYYDGGIFDMSGGTTRHSQITANITGELHQRLKGEPCTVLESNQRLKVPANGLRCYPDVSVYCGQMIHDEEDQFRETAINPEVIFEVLSPRTESYNRGFKLESYRRIESLKAYVLISRESMHVELYDRQGDRSWLLTDYSTLDAIVKLPSISVELPLSEIFDRVEFPPSPIPPMPKLPKR